MDERSLARKTMSNDVHIIAVPGSTQLFVTRSVRRFPKPWNMEAIGSVEACPWSFGYASVGSQVVLAKRISTLSAIALPEVKPRDLGAEAVMNLPPTPVAPEDGTQLERPAVAAIPPLSHVIASDSGEREVAMEDTAEAGILLAVGLQVPSTPMESTPPPIAMSTGMESSSPSGSAPSTLPTSGVHERDVENLDEASRPMKQARIMAVFEHEDDTHPLHFEDVDVDNLELYEYECDDDENEGAASSVASNDVIKRLCVFPIALLNLNFHHQSFLNLIFLQLKFKLAVLRPWESCYQPRALTQWVKYQRS